MNKGKMDGKIRRKKYDRSGNKATMLDKARKLRSEMTPQEKKLWYNYLRYYPLHWYKQFIIEGYILDFYCHSAKLAVEIDGMQHNNEDVAEYDITRTEMLSSYGIDVLRITNNEVDTLFEGVCEKINIAVEKRLNISRR